MATANGPLALAAVGGAVYLIGYGSLVRGLRVGNLSLVTPLASLQGAVAALIAIVLLGETVTGLTTAGLALAVVGSVLASASRGPREMNQTVIGQVSRASTSPPGEMPETPVPGRTSRPLPVPDGGFSAPRRPASSSSSTAR
jgi:hypothetical protein